MATVGRFSDGEVMVEIEENVRDKHVFIIQPTYSNLGMRRSKPRALPLGDSPLFRN
jgi:phosphoribosylpyrophosphate synthetase